MEKTEIMVTEGIESNWNYHLSTKEKPIKSLCQKYTMLSYLPLDAWGVVTELKETYCKKCMEIYNREKGVEDAKLQ